MKQYPYRQERRSQSVQKSKSKTQILTIKNSAMTVRLGSFGSTYYFLNILGNLVSEIRLPQISSMATNTTVEVPIAEEKETSKLFCHHRYWFDLFIVSYLGLFRSVVDGIFKSSDDNDSTENLILIFREAMDEIRERDRSSFSQ